MAVPAFLINRNGHIGHNSEHPLGQYYHVSIKFQGNIQLCDLCDQSLSSFAQVTRIYIILLV